MPTDVCLEYDARTQLLLLRGDQIAMSRHPLFGTYLRSLGAAATPEGMVLRVEEDALHARHGEIATLVERAGFTLVSGSSNPTLDKVRRDEEDFASFSAAAAAIWAGRVDPVAFATFVQRVEQACPGRRFYPKQLLAAFHLAFAQNACNFSVPGAGKTSIVYAAYAYLASLLEDDPRNVNHLVVVGPLSSFKAWEDEFVEIFERRPRSKRIAGMLPAGERSAYLRGVSYSGLSTELTLTSYSSLAGSIEEFKTFLKSPARRAMIVLDEAHNIKRPDGYWSNAVAQLAPLARARVVLTGTPAPNGYEDLANLFRFIYPKRNVIGFSNTALKAMSDGAMASAIPRLKDRIRPFYTRIRKSDLGLPGAIVEDLHVTLSPRHREIYQGIERAIIPQLRAAMRKGRSTLVTARLMRLRQAAANPALLLKPLEDEGLLGPEAADAFSIAELAVAELVAAFDPQVELTRLLDVAELARRIVREQGKVVIWSYFLGNLGLLKQALRRAASFVEIITGATPVTDGTSEAEDATALPTRESLINRFHTPGETAILIANPQAVGESISLHKACRSAIYFDRDFNAGRFIQSKDRIHRYSDHQLGEVRYHMAIADRTIDTVIDQRLDLKEQRLNDLVESEEIPLFSLGDEENETGADVRAILEDYERRKTF